MNKINKFIGLFIIIIVFLIFSYKLMVNDKNNNQVNNNPADVANNFIPRYTDIIPAELNKMLAQKDFKLVDVHIPEQKHIPGTDYLIAFNEIDEFIKTLPNKDEKIVLYCRSGGMSKILAEKLADRGYKNIFNLTRGLNGWVAEGRDVLPTGIIQ